MSSGSACHVQPVCVYLIEVVIVQEHEWTLLNLFLVKF